jgi:integrase
MARKSLRAAAEGDDPAGEKQAARNAPPPTRDLVENVAADFIAKHIESNLRTSTAREMARLLTVNVVPRWKGRRVQEIQRRDVMELLDGMIKRGAPVSANRTLAVVRRLFGWAMERGLLETSPCDRIRAPTAEQARDRVLREEEIIILWRACEKIGWPFGPLVQLLLLTGQRREEVAGMRWSELDLDAKLWTLPKERVKNGQAHEVPLSDMALQALNRLPRIPGSGTYLFSTTGVSPVSGFSRAKVRLDAAIAQERSSEIAIKERATPSLAHANWRNHDLRRTVATGMARLGINLPVVEKVLNHSSGSFGGVAGIYQRHSFIEEKRAALQSWAQFVEGLITKGLPGNENNRTGKG